MRYVLFALCVFWIHFDLMAIDRVTGKLWASRSEVLAKNGMAATSHPLATQVALEILRGGGNAVDAAIAANAALGLMEPTGCGIGGDCFALVWEASSGRLYGYNGSGRSPASLSLEELHRELDKLGLKTIPSKGVLPLSVPGTVDAWFALHERFGSFDMAAILAPAIRYAREGHPVPQVIAHYWESAVRVFAGQPGFLETFSKGGRAPGEGEIWKNPDLAATYETLAREGRDAFYKGSIAERISAFVQEHGGFMGIEDLAAHLGEWVEPVSTTYRGCQVWELPPNGQGLAALQMLNILENFDLAGMGFESVDYWHHLIEAKKLAFEDRARFYADPDFHNIPVDWLISKEYARQRAALIDPQRAARSLESGNPPQEGDTIYLTVADAAGNMVSLIQSNYRGHGSGVCPTGLGFGLQNRGESFALQDGHFNQYAPRKRPFHTIIPAFITRQGRPWISFGLMGGSMQPQGHVQIVVNLIDFGMNLQEAGDAPRMIHNGSSQPTGEIMGDGGVVALESGLPYHVLRGLKERGHALQVLVGWFGGYQAIQYDAATGIYRGASESRKDGQAAGF